jgi:hypothetical protein
MSLLTQRETTRRQQVCCENILRKQNRVVTSKLSAQQLNDVLKHMYLSARKADGEMYKVKTLESTRYSLNRYLKLLPVQKTFDIIKDNEFNEANMCFKTAITELKANGKVQLNTTPLCQRKIVKKYTLQSTLVQIRPLDCITKYSGIFACIFFAAAPKICEAWQTNRNYVTKNIDELTKNHRADDNGKWTAMMQEQPDSPFCPVRSFEKISF